MIPSLLRKVNLFLFLLFTFGLASCSDYMEALVRSGSFNVCPDKTVDQLFAQHLNGTEWDSFFGDDGEFYVNCTGQGAYNSTYSDILIQFIVTGDEWEINAIEVNSIPIDEYEIEAAVIQMCLGE